MRRSDLRKAVDHNLAITKMAAERLDQILDKLDEYRYGPPASGASSGGGTSSGGSPVETQALAGDPAAEARRRLEAAVTGASDMLAEFHAIAAAWLAPPSRAGASRGDDGCVIMAKVGVWEPAYECNPGGVLDQPTMLGRWARDFTSRNGRLPTRSEADAHAQGRDVRVAS